MTLLELTAGIESGVQQLADTERVAQEVAALKRAHAAVSDVRPIVDDAVTLLTAAIEADLDVGGDALLAMSSRVAAASEAARSNRLKLADLDRLLTDVRAEVAGVQSQVKIGWIELVDKKVPGRDGLGALAESFRLLGGVSELATELRQSLSALQQVRSATPSVEQLNRLNALADRIPTIVRDLVGDDATVRAFADKVARGGAGLASLTPEVLDWLKEKGLEKSFKIVPGSPGD